ncbi:MAG: HEAT repeat domain-containing protein, partial [Myxococcota bacterium]
DASPASVVRRWLAQRRRARPEEAPPSEAALRAAEALAGVGDPAGAPELRAAALDGRHPAEVRRRLIAALGRVKDRAAVPDLVRLLQDADLRIGVAHALGRIGDRRAIGPLVRQLRAEPHPPAREAEVEALRALGHRRVDALAAAYLGSAPRR